MWAVCCLEEHITEPPLSPELTSPAVPWTSDRWSEAECCLSGSPWRQCLMSVITYLWVTAAAAHLLFWFHVRVLHMAYSSFSALIFRYNCEKTAGPSKWDSSSLTPVSAWLLKGSCECILPLSPPSCILFYQLGHLESRNPQLVGEKSTKHTPQRYDNRFRAQLSPQLSATVFVLCSETILPSLHVALIPFWAIPSPPAQLRWPAIPIFQSQGFPRYETLSI